MEEVILVWDWPEGSIRSEKLKQSNRVRPKSIYAVSVNRYWHWYYGGVLWGALLFEWIADILLSYVIY